MEEFEDFNEAEDMKNLFERILGSEVTIKDDIDNTEEKVFTILVKRLEEQVRVETEIYKLSGLELVKVTEGLWFVVETTLKLLYGELPTEAIMWYILYRKRDEEDEIVFHDGEQEIKINTIKRLWKYVKSHLND